jgi:DNA-binding MarR family transcriptional regulator
MNSRLSSPELEAADRFHSAAIHALRFVAREDPAGGLSAARLSALSVLVFGGPQTLGELAAAEQVRPPTMTAIVRALEEAGLVRRSPDDRDGRVVRAHATAKGRRVLERARERQIAKLAERLSRLDEDELARVREAAELVDATLRTTPVRVVRPSSARPAPLARGGGSAGS